VGQNVFSVFDLFRKKSILTPLEERVPMALKVNDTNDSDLVEKIFKSDSENQNAGRRSHQRKTTKFRILA
jgi:hypothetical protein